MFYLTAVFIHPKLTHNFSCFIHFCVYVPNNAWYLFMGPGNVVFFGFLGFFLVKVLSLIFYPLVCTILFLHLLLQLLFSILNTERRYKCDFRIKDPEHYNIIWSTASNKSLLSRSWNTGSVVLNNGSRDEVIQVSWRIWDSEKDS